MIQIKFERRLLGRTLRYKTILQEDIKVEARYKLSLKEINKIELSIQIRVRLNFVIQNKYEKRTKRSNFYY